MAVPQPGIFAQGTRSHYHLEFDLLAGVTDEQIRAAVRGLREPPVTAGGANIVVGFGAALWRWLEPDAAPAALAPFEPIEGDGRRAPATQHDIWVWSHGTGEDIELDVARGVVAALAPVAVLAAEQPCFVYRDSRDLTGFIDGTENPPVESAHDVAIVPDLERGAGGSFVLAQKWVHDLGPFHAQSQEEQEATIGRTKPDSIERDDKPPTAHISRVVIEEDGEELEIYRRSTPYGTVGELGLYFLAFSADPTRFTKMMARMFGISGDGLHDRLTDFTHPVSGAFYFAPSLDDLDGILPGDSTFVRRAATSLLLVLAIASAGVALPTAGPAVAATRSYAGTVKRTIADLQEFWGETMPDVYGIKYQPIPAAKIIPYTSKSKVPQCGPGHATYKDIADNAFYCTGGGFLAYDDEHLFPDLEAKWGDFTIAITLAHEWGHAIQDQAGVTGETIYLEQQADCFAGAWVRWVDDGNSKRLFLRPGNLDTALGGFLDFRDPPGSDPTAKGAHGSAFDRVGAFQDGFDGGAQACADYAKTLPTIVEIPFSSAAEAATGGDVAFPDIFPLTFDDLDKYWSTLLRSFTPVDDIVLVNLNRPLPRCGTTKLTRQDIENTIFYCSDDNVIISDRNLLTGVYQSSGDFGVAVIISEEWAVAIQNQFDEQGTEKALALERACFSGSWAGSVARGDHDPDGRGLELSSGDLDEAVQSFLIFAAPVKRNDTTHPTAFENVAAFRTGFFQGESACVALVE